MTWEIIIRRHLFYLSLDVDLEKERYKIFSFFPLLLRGKFKGNLTMTQVTYRKAWPNEKISNKS